MPYTSSPASYSTAWHPLLIRSREHCPDTRSWYRLLVLSSLSLESSSPFSSKWTSKCPIPHLWMISRLVIEGRLHIETIRSVLLMRPQSTNPTHTVIALGRGRQVSRCTSWNVILKLQRLFVAVPRICRASFIVWLISNIDITVITF